ncbi:MAG: hypothetical protein J6X80_03770 [Lachnospiraceae bacterium]|nr:hypothetical protein [Lachnospiraceae bacterium]
MKKSPFKSYICGLKAFITLAVFLITVTGLTGCKNNQTPATSKDIKKGYIAVFSQGIGELMQETYVYKTANGKYKYTNVKAVTDGWGGPFIRTVVGSGNADSKEEIIEAAKANNAYGSLILIPEEAYDKYDPAFIESKKQIKADYPQIYMTVDEFLTQNF